MFNYKLLPLAFLALSQGVFAQQAPTAGSQLQQIPPPPVPQKAPPLIRLEQRATPPTTPGADERKILVKSMQVTGAQLY